MRMTTIIVFTAFIVTKYYGVRNDPQVMTE
jgi:hypothetical protein